MIQAARNLLVGSTIGKLGRWTTADQEDVAVPHREVYYPVDVRITVVDNGYVITTEHNSDTMVSSTRRYVATSLESLHEALDLALVNRKIDQTRGI